jgi:hypothetical protein
MKHSYALNSSSNALASWRSAVSKPSVHYLCYTTSSSVRLRYRQEGGCSAQSHEDCSYEGSISR